MFVMELRRRVPADPATVWTMLADPDAMNRWSSARVVSLQPGDGGHPGGVGAVRHILLPRRLGRLTEVVERIDPPHRFEYRVIAGAPILGHLGRIELTAAGPSATDLRWHVEITAVTRVLEPVMRALLTGDLERSLDRLIEIAPTSIAGALPPARTIDPGVDLLALRRAARAVAAHQGDFADELDRAGDPRGSFARVYQYVTEGLIDLADAGTFDHPAWLLRLLPVFDQFFTDNIVGTPEPHWQRAFAYIGHHQRRRATRFELMVRTVFAGMRAHIEEDLPRTLAKVYVDHYAAVCDHARFRADYLRMKQAFTQAGTRIMHDFPRREWHPIARLIDRVTPHALRDSVIDRYVYPITRERRRAFTRAGELAERLLARP
ncbi:MAG: DUF5995 family protein [Kofleriaceae bacterium]